ncbi:MAG: geranylgeranylglyceryl/heptaprenylglyceryl phosphate synthase [Candidatus Aenigmarchaeota archaeon]|nr:geranylgeranylglyceryl/heptaprenylglyceryl phosphate synthase [Candidatus Aenigmarchaeota archaeon]
MKVFDYIRKKLEKGRLHFSLIDPDPLKQDINDVASKIRILEKLGTDAIMIGGSTNIVSSILDDVVGTVKENCSLPVILFPGNTSGISRQADAIFFMSLLNSRNPYWIVGAQVLGAPLVKRFGIEPISMGYLVIEPGGTVSFVGDAKPLPRSKPKLVAAYALAAQYLGMSLVYLEAGSGVEEPISPEIIKTVKSAIDIPLIVGGGMKTADAVTASLEAGADIIVTGTACESDDMENTMKSIIRAVKDFRH